MACIDFVMLFLQSFLVLIAVCNANYVVVYACGLTETENENDSAPQNDVAKMMLQK